MLRDQIEDLTAEVKKSQRERDLAPLAVLGSAFFVGFLNGEDVWGRPSVTIKEVFLGFALLALIYGVLSIKVAVLQSDLRLLLREYWGSGPKAPQNEDI